MCNPRKTMNEHLRYPEMTMKLRVSLLYFSEANNYSSTASHPIASLFTSIHMHIYTQEYNKVGFVVALERECIIIRVLKNESYSLTKNFNVCSHSTLIPTLDVKRPHFFMLSVQSQLCLLYGVSRDEKHVIVLHTYECLTRHKQVRSTACVCLLLHRPTNRCYKGSACSLPCTE